MVKVEGIKEKLVLNRTGGVYDHYIVAYRKPVGLEDAQKWQQLILDLRDQSLLDLSPLPDSNKIGPATRRTAGDLSLNQA